MKTVGFGIAAIIDDVIAWRTASTGDTMSPMSPTRTIPTLDLAQYTAGSIPDRTDFVRTLGEGLVEFGFLNVEGHGIDTSAVRATYALWQRFFQLPEETKKKYAGGDGSRGFTPFGVE